MDSIEIFYSNGVVLVQLLEQKYISFEFFPNDQSENSFNKSEFDNIFKVETVQNKEFTPYELSIPSNITEEERNKVISEVVEFANSFDVCHICGEVIEDERARQDKNENIICEDCFMKILSDNLEK